MHKVFAKIYLGEFDTQFTVVRLIKLHVLIAGILLILVSLLASAIVKSSGIPKMTIYKAESNLGWLLIIPLFFGQIISSFIIKRENKWTPRFILTQLLTRLMRKMCLFLPESFLTRRNVSI